VDLKDLETIEPCCITPWHAGFEVTIPDRDKAVKWAEITRERVLFVDASYRRGNIGVSIYFGLKRGRHKIEDKQSLKIGHSNQVTANHAELIAIHQAISHVEQIWNKVEGFPPEVKGTALPTIIASDNTTALLTLSRPARQSGQSIIRKTCETAKRLQDLGGPTLRLQWVPWRSGIKGGDTAHDQTKEASTQVLPALRTAILAPTVKHIRNTSGPKMTGKYAIDSALPGKHTRQLYDDRRHKEAKVLCRLRTRHSRLNKDLVRTKALESGECQCETGQEETARHFLFELPPMERTQETTPKDCRNTM